MLLSAIYRLFNLVFMKPLAQNQVKLYDINVTLHVDPFDIIPEVIHFLRCSRTKRLEEKYGQKWDYNFHQKY